MYTPFVLEQYELFIDDKLIHEAELESSFYSIKKIKEITQGIWNFEIVKDATTDFEVELQLKANKLVEGTCDLCQCYFSARHCVHHVLCIMKLIKVIQDDNTKKTKRINKLNNVADADKKSLQGTDNSPVRLTVSHILDSINKDDLKAFIISYSRKNRDFALTFKSHFVEKINFIDPNYKYKQVIEAAKKGIFTVKKPAKNVQPYLKITNDLLQKAINLHKAATYSESFAIYKELLKDYESILKSISEPERFFSYANDILTGLWVLYRSAIAPDLKDEIFNLLNEYYKLYHNGSLAELSVWENLVENESDLEKIKILSETNDYINSNKSSKDTSFRTFVTTRYILYYKLKEFALAENWLITFQYQLDVYYNCIAYLNKIGKHKQAKKYAEIIIDNVGDYSKKNKFLKLCYEIALTENDIAQIAKLALLNFFVDYDYHYIELLKKHTSDWEEVFIYLLKELRKPPNTIQKTKAIALLLHKENRSIELLELIRQSKSVDLFIKHIDGFYTLEPTDIYDVSIYILRYYLRNHVGRNISQKTKQMLDAMTANGLNDIVRQIIAILVSEYGERNSLMEELNLKIPDSDEN